MKLHEFYICLHGMQSITCVFHIFHIYTWNKYFYIVFTSILLIRSLYYMLFTLILHALHDYYMFYMSPLLWILMQCFLFGFIHSRFDQCS